MSVLGSQVAVWLGTLACEVLEVTDEICKCVQIMFLETRNPRNNVASQKTTANQSPSSMILPSVLSNMLQRCVSTSSRATKQQCVSKLAWFLPICRPHDFLEQRVCYCRSQSVHPASSRPSWPLQQRSARMRVASKTPPSVRHTL